MSEDVKIHINLASGIVSVEAPADTLNTVFDRLESFLPHLTEAYTEIPEEVDKPEEQPFSTEERPPTPAAESSSKPSSTKKKTKPEREQYQPVSLGLDNSQRDELRAFYRAKKPIAQTDQALVIMYWLSEKAKITSIGKNEVFMGLKTVDAKIPVQIRKVLSNLKADGKIVALGRGYYKIIHTGEDYVLHELPRNP